MRINAAFTLSVLLYVVLALGANPVSAAGLTLEERAQLAELQTGDMTKLVIHPKPRDPITESYEDQYGNVINLADYRGKIVVLNLWATWCPPCRYEMPGIDRLAGAMAGDDLEVIALSMDRFDIERVIAFFEEIDAQHLGVYQDRRGKVALRAGALGLPVTLVLDREGHEIARVTGEAEWDSPEAKAMLQAIMDMTAPGA